MRITSRFKFKIISALIAIGLASPVCAQNAPEKVVIPWFMLSKLSSQISVTTSSAASLLPSSGHILWACNTGANDAYLSFGNTNSVTTAVATGTKLASGTCSAYDLYPIGQQGAPFTYVAAIGNGGSTSIYVETGIGQPPQTLGSSGGGSSSTDPCNSTATKVLVPISQTTSAQLLALSSGKKNYICAISITTADAESVSLVEGTGSVCGTGTAAIIGGTTAVTGLNFLAGGSFAFGNGAGTIAAGTNVSFNVCLLQSGTGVVAGVISAVQK